MNVSIHDCVHVVCVCVCVYVRSAHMVYMFVCMCVFRQYVYMYLRECISCVLVCTYILPLHSKHTSPNYKFSAVQQQFLPCGPRIDCRGSLNLAGKNITTLFQLTCN